MRNRVRNGLSYLLLGGGAVLLFCGVRDVVQAHWGQYEAARVFAKPPRADADRAEARPESGDTVAKLIIPRLNVELYVVEGTDAADLRRGPGHLTGSAMPGERGNCVIAGHRDTHFRILQQIRSGDRVILETDKGRFVYRVKHASVVPPTNTASLAPAPGVLHLITCYPFYYVGLAPDRFVVEAQLTS